MNTMRGENNKMGKINEIKNTRVWYNRAKDKWERVEVNLEQEQTSYEKVVDTSKWKPNVSSLNDLIDGMKNDVGVYDFEDGKDNGMDMYRFRDVSLDIVERDKMIDKAIEIGKNTEEEVRNITQEELQKLSALKEDSVSNASDVPNEN